MSRQQKTQTQSMYSWFVRRMLIPGFLVAGILMILFGVFNMIGPKDPEYTPFLWMGIAVVAAWIFAWRFFHALNH